MVKNINYRSESHEILGNTSKLRGILSNNKKHMANVLSLGSLEKFKKHIPSLMKKAEDLLETIQSKDDDKLQEATKKAKILNKDVENFLELLTNFATQDSRKFTLEGVICADMRHTVGAGQNILGEIFEMLVNEMKDPDLLPVEKEQHRNLLSGGVSRLISALETFNSIDTILEKTSIESLVPSIKERFQGLPIDMDEIALKNHSVLSKTPVFKRILGEMMENYRKHGTKGNVVVKINNNELVITLSNEKQKMGTHDTSTKKGISILKTYAEILGGSFTGEYNQDVAASTVKIPLCSE